MVLKETRMTGLSVGKNKVLICDTIPECDWQTDILSDGISWVKRTSITLMVLERGKKCEGRRNKVHVHYQWMNVNVHTHMISVIHTTHRNAATFPYTRNLQMLPYNSPVWLNSDFQYHPQVLTHHGLPVFQYQLLMLTLCTA